jgi:hypothetical protein
MTFIDKNDLALYNTCMRIKTTSGKETPMRFHYIFKFRDGISASFEVLLDNDTLQNLKPETTGPDWTRLDYHQCNICPLDPKETPYCPIATNFATLVETFGEFNSNETSHVIILAKHRDYMKSTTLQEGLSALMGIYMTTSGCPMFEKLKPLVRFHLPFASLEENVFRTVSMYLLVQYFRQKKGKTADWDLKQLPGIYDQVQKVNTGMIRRLQNAAQKNASLSAIASLDYTASLLPFVIDETLEAMETSLHAYMED